jgi:hypothetical protein
MEISGGQLGAIFGLTDLILCVILGKKNNMKKPETMWAFWANKYGPFHKTPQKVKMHYGIGEWVHKNEEYCAEKQGLDQRDGYICFSHPDKKEVEKFMQGFFACRELIGDFFKDK